MTEAGDADPRGPAALREGTTDGAAVERWYDDWAERYDETIRDWGYVAPEAIADLLLPHLAAGARVLDAGCGTGLFAEALLARRDCRIDGIDISAASLRIAERRGRYARLIRHDLATLPLPVEEDAYDAAASVGTLTYVEPVEALLRDLCRCVRPGGALAFTQRSDLWESLDFPGMIRRLEDEGLWSALHVGEPRPYLPENPEFGDEIEAVHAMFRVR